MADIDLKTETPDGTLPADGFIFGADSQSAVAPSVYTTQAVATRLLGSTTLSGGTVTASSPVLDLSQTWNNGAVTFTGLKFNATDTASAAGSLLMDLQTGGVSRLNVRKNGTVTVTAGSSAAGSQAITFADNLNAGMYAAFQQLYFTGNAVNINTQLFSTNNINVTDNAASFRLGSAFDVTISRRAAANLRLGAADAAAPVAQTLSVQSVVAGTTNTPGQEFRIDASQGTGSAAGGSIVLRVAPAGGDGTAQNALVDALTINSLSTVIQRGVGYNWHYKTSNNQRLTFEPNGVNIGGGVDGNGFFAATYSFVSSLSAVADLFLLRDAANTLALRNGTNAQAFRVYETYTDASNYARAFIRAPAGASVEIGTEGAGTGSSTRSLVITVGGTQRWQFQGSSGNLRAVADNTVDIGGAADNRPRDIYAAGTVSPGRGVTVAGLPTPSTGMMARVTDATTPIVGSTVVGGGAAAALVWYNGANWTVIGV